MTREARSKKFVSIVYEECMAKPHDFEEYEKSKRKLDKKRQVSIYKSDGFAPNAKTFKGWHASGTTCRVKAKDLKLDPPVVYRELINRLTPAAYYLVTGQKMDARRKFHLLLDDRGSRVVIAERLDYDGVKRKPLPHDYHADLEIATYLRARESENRYGPDTRIPVEYWKKRQNDPKLVERFQLRQKMFKGAIDVTRETLREQYREMRRKGAAARRRRAREKAERERRQREQKNRKLREMYRQLDEEPQEPTGIDFTDRSSEADRSSGSSQSSTESTAEHRSRTKSGASESNANRRSQQSSSPRRRSRTRPGASDSNAGSRSRPPSNSTMSEESAQSSSGSRDQKTSGSDQMFESRDLDKENTQPREPQKRERDTSDTDEKFRKMEERMEREDREAERRLELERKCRVNWGQCKDECQLRSCEGVGEKKTVVDREGEENDVRVNHEKNACKRKAMKEWQACKQKCRKRLKANRPAECEERYDDEGSGETEGSGKTYEQ